MAKKRRKSSRKPLSEDNKKSLLCFMDANEINVTDLARSMNLEPHTLASALKGKNIIMQTRARIILFIKNKKLSEKPSVKEMKLAGTKERLTSTQPVNQETILIIKQFMVTTGLKQTDIAKMLELKRSSFQDALYGEKSVCFKNREKVEKFGKRLERFGIGKLKVTGVIASVSESVEQRVERIKHLLLALESDLRFFKDSREARAFFKRLLNTGDVGYMGCLLTALTGDEAQFRRWFESSTYQFDLFKGKG